MMKIKRVPFDLADYRPVDSVSLVDVPAFDDDGEDVAEPYLKKVIEFDFGGVKFQMDTGDDDGCLKEILGKKDNAANPRIANSIYSLFLSFARRGKYEVIGAVAEGIENESLKGGLAVKDVERDEQFLYRSAIYDCMCVAALAGKPVYVSKKLYSEIRSRKVEAGSKLVQSAKHDFGGMYA